jgi:hypothetical protein
LPSCALFSSLFTFFGISSLLLLCSSVHIFLFSSYIFVILSFHCFLCAHSYGEVVPPCVTFCDVCTNNVQSRRVIGGGGSGGGGGGPPDGDDGGGQGVVDSAAMAAAVKGIETRNAIIVSDHIRSMYSYLCVFCHDGNCREFCEPMINMVMEVTKGRHAFPHDDPKYASCHRCFICDVPGREKQFCQNLEKFLPGGKEKLGKSAHLSYALALLH